MRNKVIAYVIIFFLLFLGLPVENVWALQTEEDISIKVTVNGEKIENGRKNIDYNIDTIYISSENETFKPNGNSNIKIYTGDEEKTDKFKISKLDDGRLKIEIKEISDENIYKLLEHKLYKINIPKNIFVSEDGTKINKEENFYFVTRASSGPYTDGIVKNILPVNETKAVDYKNGIITVEFIEDISLNPEITSHIDSQGNIDAIENINKYIEISNADVYHMNTYKSDSILNYRISCDGNKLILQSKDNEFKDFTKYNVKIKEQAIFLTRSQDRKVYNNNLEINFYTNDFIEKTVPINKGLVGVEPTLEVHFKYPISIDTDDIIVNDTVSKETIDATKTLLRESGNPSDQKVVYINITDGKLQSNRTYKVHIPKNAVSFKENPTVQNEEINVYFNTMTEGSNPYPVKYSSNQSCTDDIRGITTTSLLKDGSIYIKFNTPIQADKDYSNKDNKNIVPFNDTKLYKITKAKGTTYSPSGERFDSEFMYNKELSGTVSQIVYGTVYTDLIREEISMKDIEIIEPDIIKIKPDIPLLNLNQYELILDDKIIEDKNGHNLKKENLAFNFWTKADSTRVNPSWNTNTNTNKISKSDPIVIDILGEVIPSAKDFSIMSNGYRNKALEKIILNEGHYIQENTTIGDKEISIQLQLQREIKLSLSDGLLGNTTVTRWESKNIDIATVDSSGLVKGINKGSATIYAISKEGNILSKITVEVEEGENRISKFTIQYYYDANNKKHTKILLNPNKDLISGKKYKLYIPANTFQARSNEYLPSLIHEFVVKGSTELDPTIEIENLKGNTVSVLDLLTKDHLYFYIYGYNFNSTIKQIVLQGAGDKEIIIDKKDIAFISEDELKVDITGTLKSSIAKESAVGEYTIKLIFENGESKDKSNFKFKITSQGAPTYTVKFPTGNNLDEESLKRNGRYFIHVTFKDPDGTLRVNGEAGLATMLDCIVATAGSSETLLDKEYIIDIKQMGELDRDKYINENILIKDASKKEATLYIPIKKLRPKVTYQAIIRAGILTNAIAQNAEINWTFGTKTIPHISDITIGSVVEDYDEDEPIILKGNFLNIEGVSVYFNDIKAEKTEFEDKKDQNGNLIERDLKVFLPDGSDKLDAGIYDIVIKNDENHQTTLYGKLSIVKGGDEKDIPNEAYKLKKDKSVGEVRGDLRVSKDILYLSSKYSNDSYINLDLDELMGIDTWTRIIKYEGDKRDRIGVLETKSTYGDISLLNLRLDQYAKEDDISIRLGRVEPYVRQNIKSKLKGYSIYSELIQASGENFKVDNVSMKIPFRYTSGKNIKVLRYDENTRNLYPVYATVNLVDKKAEFMSTYPGIFVVVEE